MNDFENQVLKGVSRSFYLTLRLLPEPMRGAASLGYLLARTSDTLADSARVPMELRRQALDRFRRCIAEDSEFTGWSAELLDSLSGRSELHLLQLSWEILNALRNLPAGEAALVREVLEIIIGGQSLDLERFALASKQTPVVLRDDSELEDYTWRVAGSVGAFWTKLGFLTLGEKFSTSSESWMLVRGISYGKGLQLVNILRDMAEDLAVGRCYLPVADSQDFGALVACHGRWLVRAEDWLTEGEEYADSLPRRRLRAATVLPALLARKTLEPLRGAAWVDLQRRNKIPRSAVYRSLCRAFIG